MSCGRSHVPKSAEDCGMTTIILGKMEGAQKHITVLKYFVFSASSKLECKRTMKKQEARGCCCLHSSEANVNSVHKTGH